MENKAYVFVSNKDKNSIVLLDSLQKINNWQTLFSIVSVHAQKKLVKDLNIKKIPSILWNENLFVGQDALIFVKENINQKQNTTKEKKQNFSEYSEENFSPLQQEVPRFTSIEENTISENKDMDINARMQQYNMQRQALDETIEQKKA